ncbi:MAG: protein-L-isoaspartate O-methyltransferase [Pseudomonadota bacterium]
MTDFAERRRVMVDTQVRPSDVTKFPIIDAMLKIPREDFVPAARREAAYIGENIDLAPGRCVLEPRTLAKMLDALELPGDALVLDIGAAYGYSAAVIAQMTAAVVALEEDAGMAAEAQDALMAAGADTVIVHEGPLAIGAAQHGPYDAIVVQGAVEMMPQAILDQLKDGGRIISIFTNGALGEVRLGVKSGARVSWRAVFNAGAPVLPGFAATPAFSL